MKSMSLYKKSNNFRFSFVAFVALFWVVGTISAATENEEYWSVVSARAQKIVDSMGIGDVAKSDRVRDIIANQYVGLNAIHEARDLEISRIKAEGTGSHANVQIDLIRLRADVEVGKLHSHFIGELSAELDPEEIVQVKDGLTYGVVPLTYGRYMELLPNIGEQHRRFVYARLVEARERAMDAGSAKGKHREFNIAKGKINNYMSKVGVDMKEAELALDEKERAARAR